MKWILIPLIFLLGLTSVYPQEPQGIYDSLDGLYEKYVSQGLIDYHSLTKDSVSFNRAVSDLLLAKGETMDSQERAAWWINVYNALVIKKVINNYPVRSVNEISGFFTAKIITHSGETLSLDQIENEKVKAFQDPRMYFALVCGANGCPPINIGTYRGIDFDKRLDSLVSMVLSDQRFLEISEWKKQIKATKILFWHKDEINASYGSTRLFLEKYTGQSISKRYKIKYQRYDWGLNDLISGQQKEEGSNVTIYRATALLLPDKAELKIFNNLYTQRNYDGFENFNSRSSYFSSFIQFLYGLNKNINIGGDVVYKSNVINDWADEIPFKVFRFRNDRGYLTSIEGDTLQTASGIPLHSRWEHGLSHFGPKIKINPLKSIPELAMQQTVYIPVQTNVDGSPILFTQFFYDRLIGTEFQLFAEGSLWVPTASGRQVDFFGKIFFSYFPSDKWTVYVMTTIPEEIGVGSKYYIAPWMELELLYTKYLSIDNFVDPNSKPETFNFGIRMSF